MVLKMSLVEKLKKHDTNTQKSITTKIYRKMYKKIMYRQFAKISRFDIRNYLYRNI